MDTKTDSLVCDNVQIAGSRQIDFAALSHKIYKELRIENSNPGIDKPGIAEFAKTALS